jgi:outer membrane receptor for ferrienterochelin and colicin
MKKHVQLLLVSITLGMLSVPMFAQKCTISGHIKDFSNGETLIGVGLYIKNTTTGVVSNAYGFYSLSLNQGKHNIIVSYVGYEIIDTLLNLTENRTLDFELKEGVKQLQEVVVKAERAQNNVTSTQMSVVNVSSKVIKQIPVAFGEADVLKTLVLLPGVKSSDDGGSTLSVRGGGRDQNLIMLDEATVYNASHLGNLLSVFNNDALQNVEFFKGNMPAQYGGRLSSVIDMRMKDGNNKQFSGSGGIGTLSSRLTLEGPIVKDKGSFIISGRRAYIDLLTKVMHAINDTSPVVPYYFYDLNLKANYSINSRNKIFLSGYFGKDVFEMNSSDETYSTRMAWGNYTGTLRWNSIFSERIFTNLTLLVSNYNYSFGNSLIYGKPKKESKFDWEADLLDYSIKYDIGYYMNDKHTIKTGLMSTWHDFNPGKVVGKDDTMRYNFRIPVNQALEHAVYLADEYRVTPKLTVELGIRYSLFQNMGKTNVYTLNDEYRTIDTLKYGEGDIYNHFQAFEPRLALTYRTGVNSSIKAGYSRTSQYVHVASNSNVGSLIDIWVGSGVNIKPQLADLYSAGFFLNALDNQLETSIEVYYKDMYNQIEFREFATPQFNDRMDEDFRFGKGRSYGVELFVKKSTGDLTGWISYTWSKAEKKTEDIQEKGWYLSSFDRTHDLSVVAMYELTKRLSFSANFQLKSGRPFTSPAKRYEYGGVSFPDDSEQDDGGGAVIPYFPGRNNDRMPVYHRLDIALTWKGKDKPGRRYHSDLNFSVFDLYNRANPMSINFRPDEDNENITKAYKQTFLGFMPAITWNFSF